MAISYFGTRISDNIIHNENDGTIVCKNAVIARTGFQEYLGKELPAEELKDIGMKVYDDDKVSVYRSPDEVFSRATISSFEGKPLTCGHPKSLLDINTIADHQCGHVQNVRKGPDALPTGDWPLIGDVLVTDADAIQQILSGQLRELSCGYNFHIKKEGNQILQVDMLGNHVALVESGRAGPHAKIVDSMPTVEITAQTETEKPKMAISKKFLQALGLQTFLKDAKPEDAITAMDAMAETVVEKAEHTGATDEDTHPKGCKCSDCKGGMDAAAKDKEMRDGIHKILDRMLDERDTAAATEDEEYNKGKETLAGLLAGGAGAIASKEAQAHGADEDMEAEDEESDEEEGESAEDEAVQSEASPLIPPADRQEKVVPSATDSSISKQILKTLKPVIAASSDKKVRAAFDSVSKMVYAKPVAGKTSSKAFARAAGRTTATDSKPVDVSEAANAAYAKMKRTNYTN